VAKALRMDLDDDVESEPTAAASRESTPEEDWASLETSPLLHREEFRDN
jgi:hypothetical protein